MYDQRWYRMIDAPSSKRLFWAALAAHGRQLDVISNLYHLLRIDARPCVRPVMYMAFRCHITSGIGRPSSHLLCNYCIYMDISKSGLHQSTVDGTVGSHDTNTRLFQHSWINHNPPMDCTSATHTNVDVFKGAISIPTKDTNPNKEKAHSAFHSCT